MKKIILALILPFISVTGVLGADFIRATNLDMLHSASCRVSVSNARGTGTFIGEDKENNRCLILTNYHVVTNSQTATLDFWTNSERQSISGKVIWRAYDAKAPADFAVIAVDPDELKRINPPYVALGGKGVAPDNNSYILSSGCPKGRFAQAWKGKVLGYYNGSTVMFQPGPVPGQSGSAVVSEIDGELWVTGILTWLIGSEGADDSKGGAIPIANLYDALDGRSNTNDNASPIPPDAVECAERAPYVLEFSQNNCPPCIAAEKEVTELRIKGVRVVSYNVSTSAEGREKARRYGITGTPTFIVCNGTGTEITRYLGTGHVKEILDDTKRLVDSNKAEEKPLELVIEEPKSEPDKSPLAEEEPSWIEYAPLETSTEPNSQDFRKRAPVYEYSDINFFDDSNSRWLNRRRERTPEPEPEPEEPKTEKKGGILPFGKKNEGGGLLGGGNSLDSTIDKAIDKLEKKFDKKIDDRLDSLKTKALDIYYIWRWRLLMLICAIAILCAISIECVLWGIKKTYFFIAPLWTFRFDDEYTQNPNLDVENKPEPENKEV